MFHNFSVPDLVALGRDSLGSLCNNSFVAGFPFSLLSPSFLVSSILFAHMTSLTHKSETIFLL